jgi:hypothetical protein
MQTLEVTQGPKSNQAEVAPSTVPRSHEACPAPSTAPLSQASKRCPSPYSHGPLPRIGPFFYLN